MRDRCRLSFPQPPCLRVLARLTSLTQIGELARRLRIMHLDELSFEIRLEGRTTKGSSSGRIMRLVPVFILEMHNPDELQNICPSSSRWIMRP